MLKTLKIKFVAVIMLIVTVMLAVIFGLVLYFTKTNAEQASIQMLQSVAVAPVRPNRPDDLPNEVRLPFFTLQRGRDGELTAEGGGYYDLSDKAFLEELAQRVFSLEEQTGVIEEYSLRYRKGHSPAGEYAAFADISSERKMLENLVRSCIFISIISLAVFFVISLLLAQWAVKPVAAAWEQQRQFVADASHELKTPLTVIITNAEMLREEGYSEHSRRQFSDSILKMSVRMRGLVENLLDLARVDNGTAFSAFEQFDLSIAVTDGLLPFEPLFYEKEKKLLSEIEEGIFLKGDRLRICQVLDILMDNALKYTAEKTAVTVKLSRHGQHCILSVSGQGDAISRADCRNIFKRFYRVDKARNDGRSYGLGLSIAESIVYGHKGKIWAESRSGVNTFYVQLPL